MGKGVGLSGLNEFLRCPLCEGYLVDATTITDCPHSFCRSCILRYIEETADREGNSLCPECPKNQWNPVETPIRAEARHLVLQPDLKLQDLVYKLVPGLYKEELRRRREFFAEGQGKSEQGSKWERHLAELFIFTPDELISFSLQSGFPPKTHRFKEEAEPKKEDPDTPSPKKKKKKSPKGSEEQKEKEAKLRELKFKRYFQCPAAVQIGQLKKLLFYKLELPPKYKMEVFHSEPEALKDNLSLMDLAYIYSWQRKSPMQLYFNIVKPELDDLVEPPPLLVAQLSPALPSPIPSAKPATPPPPPASIPTTAVSTPVSTGSSSTLHTHPVPVTAAHSLPPPRKKRKPSQPKRSVEAEGEGQGSAPRMEDKMETEPPPMPLMPPMMPPGMMGYPMPFPPFGPRPSFFPPHFMSRFGFHPPNVSAPMPMPHHGIFPSNPSSPSNPLNNPQPPCMGNMGRPGSTGSMPSLGMPRQSTSSPLCFPPPPPLMTRPPAKRGLPPSCPPPLIPSSLAPSTLPTSSAAFPPLPASLPSSQPLPTSLPTTSGPRGLPHPLTGIPTVLYDGTSDSRGMQGLLVFPHRI